MVLGSDCFRPEAAIHDPTLPAQSGWWQQAAIRQKRNFKADCFR